MREFPSLRVGRSTLCTRRAIDFVEAIHVELSHERRELRWQCQVLLLPSDILVARTLLCLKWLPRMLRLNSPTFDTTNDVPSSVHAIKCADLGSEIILPYLALRIALGKEKGVRTGTTL